MCTRPASLPGLRTLPVLTWSLTPLRERESVPAGPETYRLKNLFSDKRVADRALAGWLVSGHIGWVWWYRLRLHEAGTGHPPVPWLSRTYARTDQIETHYAKSGELNIAYQVFDSGDFNLLFIPGWTSHSEKIWTFK